METIVCLREVIKSWRCEVGVLTLTLHPMAVCLLGSPTPSPSLPPFSLHGGGEPSRLVSRTFLSLSQGHCLNKESNPSGSLVAPRAEPTLSATDWGQASATHW